MKYVEKRCDRDTGTLIDFLIHLIDKKLIFKLIFRSKAAFQSILVA